MENVPEEISELLPSKHTEKHRTPFPGTIMRFALLGRHINRGSRWTTSEALTPKTPKASSGVQFAVEIMYAYSLLYSGAAIENLSHESHSQRHRYIDVSGSATPLS